MNQERETALHNQMDLLFTITQEALEGKGEDSYCCCSRGDTVLVSVFDGCGGLGSRIYANMSGHTGAYIGSRLVSGAVNDWYYCDVPKTWPDEQRLLSCLDARIKKAFAVGNTNSGDALKLKGSMVRDLPTTAAIALGGILEDSVSFFLSWAGDSRIYLLDEDGLAQLTRDDLHGEDAMSNLLNDGAMTNVLSADGRYILHSRSLHVRGPAIIFAATDGCFGYLPSPMHFEYLLLSALQHARDFPDFSKRLNRAFADCAQDDFTFGCTCLRFGSFSRIQKQFIGRTAVLEQQYIEPMQQNLTTENILSLWNTYRANYERYL